MPTQATTHIQKMAPGPPMSRAAATPKTLPTPTRAANEMAKAWKEDDVDNAPGPASRTADLPDHIGQVAHLDTAGDDGEERAGSDEDPHGDVSRDPVGGGLEGIREGVH